MQVELLLFTFYSNGRLQAVSIRKPSEQISNFWMVWFLKTESEPNFGFPHITSADECISWSIDVVCLIGFIQSHLPYCSCWCGIASWTAKTWHHPAGDEAGGWHGVWLACWQRQVDLSRWHASTLLLESQSARTDSCMFVIVSDQPDAQETCKIVQVLLKQVQICLKFLRCLLLTTIARQKHASLLGNIE